MMIFKSPQVNDQERIHYQAMGDIIEVKAFNLVSKIEDDEEIIVEELVSTTYFDLSNVEQDKLYIPQHPIGSVSKGGDILRVELLNYIGSDATEEERFPEWTDLEETEFDIPEDAIIYQLEEMIIPDPPENELDKVIRENKALEAKIDELKQQINKDRQINEQTNMELLNLLMSLS